MSFFMVAGELAAPAVIFSARLLGVRREAPAEVPDMNSIPAPSA